MQMQAERRKLKEKQRNQVLDDLEKCFHIRDQPSPLHCLVTSSAEGVTGDLMTESLTARFGALLSGMKAGRRP